jgi:hypothetical protein
MLTRGSRAMSLKTSYRQHTVGAITAAFEDGRLFPVRDRAANRISDGFG